MVVGVKERRGVLVVVVVVGRREGGEGGVLEKIGCHKKHPKQLHELQECIGQKPKLISYTPVVML